MPIVLKYALDLIGPIIWFFVYYLIFYRLHRPAVLWRRRIFLPLVALWVILLGYVVNPMVFTQMSVVMFYLLFIAVTVIFALLCGDLRRSLITVVYYIATVLFLDFIPMFAEFVLSGADDFLAIHIGGQVRLSPVLQSAYFWAIVKESLTIPWAVFYCHVVKKYPVKLPLRSWLLTVFPPVLSIAALIYLWNAAENYLEAGINIYGIGLVVGIFLFLLNCFSFYWHISILATRQAEETLLKLRKEAPPEKPDTDTPFDSGGLPERVWTPQEGFIDAFVVKHKLSPREKQALELLLEGNSDKAIAYKMGVSINSVGVYLRRLYAKTGVSGRFGLLTFVYTGVK